MKRIPVSPETRALKARGLLYRNLKRFFGPSLSTIKWQVLQYRWRSFSDPRKIPWNWELRNANRIDLVNLLLREFDSPIYLEIGCASNVLFDAVTCTRKYGVDPYLGGNIRKTSDDFFQTNKQEFDVIFIDGLHSYEQVRRDILNSIKVTKPFGWVLIHDMLPKNWQEQHIPRITPHSWTGDVWKVAHELIHATGIEFKILNIDMGIGIIRVVDKKYNIPDLHHFLRSKNFDYYFDNLKKLPIIEYHNFAQTLNEKI